MSQKSFPYKLYHLIQALNSNDDGGDSPSANPLIAWLSHGRAFAIRNQQEFTDKVVPVYFKQTKWRSFVRQLNLWGFKRIMDGPDRGAWFHPHFLRGKPSSLASIKRTAVKKNLAQHPPHQIIMPDFYVMPEIAVDRPDEAMRVMGIGQDWPTLDHLLQMNEINHKDGTKDSNGSEIVDPTDMLDGIVQLPVFAPKSATAIQSSNEAANLNGLLQAAPSPPSSHPAIRRISWNGNTSTAASTPPYAYALNPSLLGATGQPYNQNVGYAVPLQRQASNAIQELQLNSFNAMMSYNWQNDAINVAHVNNEDDLVTKAIRYANMSTARRASYNPMFTTSDTQPNLQNEFVASTPQLDAHPDLGATTHPMNVNQGGQYLKTNQVVQRQPDQDGSMHSSVTLPLTSTTNATTSLESHPSFSSTLSYLAGGIKEEDNTVFPSEELVSFQEASSANIHGSFHESNDDDDEFAQFIHDSFPVFNDDEGTQKGDLLFA